MAPEFVEDDDYEYDHDKKTVELTREGRPEDPPVAQAAENWTRWGCSTSTSTWSGRSRSTGTTRSTGSIVVRDGEVVIVDEFTGPFVRGTEVARRHPPGRRGQGGRRGDGRDRAGGPDHGPGLLPPLRAPGRHDRHRGQSRPASSARSTAATWSRCPPTGRDPPAAAGPRLRHRRRPKWAAIAEEICRAARPGPAVLIGTRSIDKSEHLSELLAERGIEHQVLNANHIAEEAEIVAAAGQIGKVTVSTNMAGRGTDIRLGEGVAELGGLHVICTEMHDAPRIDRQLRGRCGRQGDPGTLPPIPGAGGRAAVCRPGPEEGGQVRGDRPEGGRPAGALRAPLPQGPEEGREAPFPPPPRPDVLREAAQENATANGPGPISRFAELTPRDLQFDCAGSAAPPFSRWACPPRNLPSTSPWNAAGKPAG